MRASYSQQTPDARTEDAPLPIKKGRLMSGLTQEAMAEVLGIDPRTLRRYESGEDPTPDALMTDMAERVKSPILLYEHFKTKYRIADDLMPSVEEVNLTQAVVGLLNALADLERHQVASQLLAMASDGMIDMTEEAHYSFVLSKLENVRQAVEQLRYCDKGGNT